MPTDSNRDLIHLGQMHGRFDTAYVVCSELSLASTKRRFSVGGSCCENSFGCSPRAASQETHNTTLEPVIWVDASSSLWSNIPQSRRNGGTVSLTSLRLILSGFLHERESAPNLNRAFAETSAPTSTDILPDELHHFDAAVLVEHQPRLDEKGYGMKHRVGDGVSRCCKFDRNETERKGNETAASWYRATLSFAYLH